MQIISILVCFRQYD